MNYKLADALLRRKELSQKVDQIRTVKDKDLFEIRFQRKKISEDMDDLTTQVPKCDLSQVTAEYDYYANKLRLIDGAIQQLNWTADITVDDKVWVDYSDIKPKGKAKK